MDAEGIQTAVRQARATATTTINVFAIHHFSV
jgi:hypothetical protein